MSRWFTLSSRLARGGPRRRLDLVDLWVTPPESSAAHAGSRAEGDSRTFVNMAQSSSGRP